MVRVTNICYTPDVIQWHLVACSDDIRTLLESIGTDRRFESDLPGSFVALGGRLVEMPSPDQEGWKRTRWAPIA